ncbi:hypothetical protein [Streptomyces sp. NPDC001657]|uniref:hypothetical protein n=1 Tax=Streptomyces sp. NPDC001657 TaxID=3154522 RepID=UPI0033243949
MISQIVTLVGVLIGALTSYLATASAERAKHRRTLETRWDERKLATYIEYMALVKEAQRAAKEAWASPEDCTEALAAMEAAEGRRSLAFESLVLLAHPSAIEAAHEVNRALWRVIAQARELSTVALPTPEVIHALNVLHQEARRDLGIDDALFATAGP